MDDSGCPYPECFFCLMQDINPAKRRPSIAKFFKELPGQDDEGQIIPISGLWNSAMAQPSNPELVDLGVFECMAALIWKGLTNRRWLVQEQNIYIPYYAAHIIGSYTMVVEDFAERAVAAGVIPALLELLRGRLTWVEQRVAVRALGHLATYDSTFSYVGSYIEILELAMQLAADAPEIVYTTFYQFPDKRLAYHCDLLTRGAGELEMESRTAEVWASQLQCWSLQLINCFAFKHEFLPTICRPEFLSKLPNMWGGLANQNSPAGVGLLGTLCHQELGRRSVSGCPAVVEALCNVARSSDDWQHLAIDSLVWLVKDPNVRHKVLDKALATVVDLAELPSGGEYRRLGDMLVHLLLRGKEIKFPSEKTRAAMEELELLHQRIRQEKSLPREDMQIRLAAALVCKLEGNVQFSAGDMVGAVSKYTEALSLCPVKLKKERVTLYSNRAQCQLLLQNPVAAISDATRALSLHNPVNRHARSLWRRAQAYDCLGLAKESLLDAIMFVNECVQGRDSELKQSNGKVPRYVDELIKKQMKAAWLFKEAAAKHGFSQQCDGVGDYDGEELGDGEECGSSAGDVEEDEESEWETASESDAELRRFRLGRSASPCLADIFPQCTFKSSPSRNEELVAPLLSGTKMHFHVCAAAVEQSSNGALLQKSSKARMVPVEQLKRASQISPLPLNGTANGMIVKSPPTYGGLTTGTEVPSSFERVAVLPSDEGFSWSKENYSKLQRTIDVWSFVLTLRARLLLIDAKWSYFGGFSEEKQKLRRRRTASWVRESILQLGPTFIKLGQLSSTRSDLFPAEFVEELAKLQDRVPAFSAEKAEALIEKELGAPLKVLFDDFERQPLAAASLGQVHRAVLRNGERVVVKVQRPGLKELFDIDLSNLKKIAEYFQKNETLGGPTRDWLGIYEECATVLYQEIDYINEGRNADKFRRDFRNIKWVRVPQIFWDYTSRNVLTLEYLPGIKINDVASLDAGTFDRSMLASRAIEAYLIQILRTGFFHADPHPGNLAVSKDGSLIYYDFGMMGEIKSFTRAKLLELFYAVYEEDANKVIQGLIDLGALLPTGDMGSVKNAVKFFLKNLTNQRPDQASTLSAIGEDLFAIAIDQPFRFPATFTFVLRAFSTLEGIGYTLDPDFSFTKVAAPYAQELLDVRESRKDIVQELGRQANEARDAAVAVPIRVQRIENFIQQLEGGDVKLRVRVLEAERAARKANVMQTTTMNLVAAATLLNIGVTLNAQGSSSFATAAFVGAGILSLLIFNGMKRVQQLDKFEDMIK